MIHQKRRKQHRQTLDMEKGDDEELSAVRFQEPEETRHRQGTTTSSSRHGRHRRDQNLEQDQQPNNNNNNNNNNNTKSKKKSHHRRSSSSSDAHEKARRYIYSAISATFFFVLFRELGWIDKMQNAVAESDLSHYISNRENPKSSAGSVPSLVSVAANMAATSMRIGNTVDETSSSMSGKTVSGMNEGQLLGNSKNFLSRKEMMDYVTLQDESIVPGSRPIMYTFFEWIPPRNRGTSMSDIADKALITEWKAAWKAAGWHPIVLTLQDSKAHPDYADYAPKLSKINMLGVGNGGGTVVYNQLCFYRWLAVAAVGGGFMSDYDVFPVSRAPSSRVSTLSSSSLSSVPPPHDGNFTVYCRIRNSRTAGIPCLMSGRAEEWTRMAYALLENGIQNANSGETMWSDMLALIDLRHGGTTYQVYDAVLEGHNVLLDREWTVDDCNITATKEAVHFSHESLRLGYLPPGETAENRPEIIRRFLTTWRQLCSSQMEAKQVVLGDADDEY